MFKGFIPQAIFKTFAAWKKMYSLFMHLHKIASSVTKICQQILYILWYLEQQKKKSENKQL